VAQFDPSILGSGDITLSTFSDQELSILNQHVIANYSLTMFSPFAMQSITLQRQSYLTVLRAQGPASAEATFRSATNIIHQAFTDNGFGISLKEAEELWAEIPAAVGTYTATPINKDNFNLQMQNQMMSDLTTMFSRTPDAKDKALIGIKNSTLPDSNLVTLVKKALLIPDASKLHEDPKFANVVLTPLMELRRTAPADIATRISNAFNQMNPTRRINMSHMMGLDTYWADSAGDPTVFGNLIKADLTSSAQSQFPNQESSASKTFQKIIAGLFRNFELADPDPDKTRLDIAAVLLNGIADIRDTEPTSTTHAFVQIINKGFVEKVTNELVAMTRTAVATQNQTTMDAVSKPILEAAYGPGAAANYRNVNLKQQDSALGSTVATRDRRITKDAKTLDVEKNAKKASDALGNAMQAAAVAAGIATFTTNVVGIGPIDATAATLKAYTDLAVISGRDAIFNNPASKLLGLNRFSPIYDLVAQDLIQQPAKGAIAAVQKEVNQLFGGVMDSILTGQPIRAFEGAKSPADMLGMLGKTALGGAFPWLLPPDSKLSSPLRKYLVGTGALDNFLGISAFNVYDKGGMKIEQDGRAPKIDNSFIDAVPSNPIGALPKPQIVFADDNGVIRYEFKLLPAMKSNTQLGHGQDGQDVPFPSYGISYSHVQNIASIDVPGGTPLFQSLGISADIIEIVGEVVSYGFRAVGGTKDFSQSMFPFGPDLNAEGSGNKKIAGALSNNATERTSYRAYGAWNDVEEGLMKLTKEGKPIHFKIMYSYLNAADTSFAAIDYKVYIARVQRIHARRDKVYYKITMIRTEWKGFNNGSTDMSDTAAKAEELFNKKKAAQLIAPPVSQDPVLPGGVDNPALSDVGKKVTEDTLTKLGIEPTGNSLSDTAKLVVADQIKNRKLTVNNITGFNLKLPDKPVHIISDQTFNGVTEAERKTNRANRKVNKIGDNLYETVVFVKTEGGQGRTVNVQVGGTGTFKSNKQGELTQTGKFLTEADVRNIAIALEDKSQTSFTSRLKEVKATP